MADRPSSGVPAAMRPRRGLTLLEVIVALGILGGVMLGLGVFSIRLSQSTSSARLFITAAQLASQRIEDVRGAPRYSAIDSLFVATEGAVSGGQGLPNFSRRTWVTRVGGGVADTIDYKIVTVQVSNPQISGSVSRTTVIAPY
jgi:prepilin-type N-terminal cleavage/methylation domain-containing protein